MGRESRQARRARERREQQMRQKRSSSQSDRWMIIGGVAIVAVVVVAIGASLIGKSLGSSSTSAQIPTPVPGKTISGLQCNYTEQLTYHVHAHITMIDAGKQVHVPAFVGFNYDHDCLYWTHTHDSTGIIHVEAPTKIVPTLGAFFDVWGKPLSRTRLASASVKPGQQMKVWVNLKPYSGNPRSIRLEQHTDITIEIGSPFEAPKRFNFAAYNV